MQKTSPLTEFNQEPAPTLPPDVLPIIPKPRRATLKPGTLLLSGHIACEEPDFLPRIRLEAEQWNRLTDHTFNLDNHPTPTDGDIRVTRSPGLQGYRLQITPRYLSLQADTTENLSHGIATLSQLMMKNSTSLPCLDILDWPDAAYRGLMLDLGRHPHTVNTLKKVIRMCHLYKLNVLHLHLSDTEIFSFASTHYPDLNVPNVTISLEDWKRLEDYATLNGVTLLPELDLPGHAAFFLSRRPELRCNPPHALSVCLGKDETLTFFETLLDEICQVFTHSPWFHLGADEAQADGWEKCQYCQEAMRRNGWKDPQELYRNFIVKANERIRAHGKRTIVWEGFAPQGQVEIPKDVIVMVFESLYHLPGDLVKEGYDIINASWQPLYLEGAEIGWPPCHVFNWNKFRWENWWDKSAAYPNGLTIEPTHKVLGGTMCSWNVKDQDEMKLLPYRLAALAEQLWNPQSRRFRNLQQRWHDMETALRNVMEQA